jgi:hypothetical protein
MALSFIVAYRQYSTENDKLQVDVSTDCGTTWTTLWTKSGSALSTGAATINPFTSPNASEWRSEVVDLTSYDNTDDVLIRFRATSNYGNNLLLDNINIDANMSVLDVDDNVSLSLFPNPADNATTLRIESNQSSDALISIYNTLGEMVYSSSTYINSGANEVNLNTSGLVNGMYLVNIQVAEEMYNLRLSITR